MSGTAHGNGALRITPLRDAADAKIDSIEPAVLSKS
jgi:hypothetical protein